MGEWDYVWSINGQEVFEMNHNQICNLVKGSGNQLQMVIERGDHIVPNFEEIWPSDKNKDDKYKRRLIGMENYTTCGKLGIEINQYNCPIECYDEAVIEEMTEDREMLTNPELVEKRKDLQSTRVQHDNPLIQQKMMNFDPRKSNVLTTLAAEERDKATRHA